MTHTIITRAVNFWHCLLCCKHFPEMDFDNLPTLKSFRFKDRQIRQQMMQIESFGQSLIGDKTIQLFLFMHCCLYHIIVKRNEGYLVR